MSSRILVLPDSHAHPEHNNERFTWFGKLVHDIKPDVVVNLGDLADMASLCAHSKASELEGARYEADCNAAKDAQDRIFHEVRKAKKKLPRFIWTLGNHDIRPQRFADDNPVLDGKLKNEDIGYKDYPWEVYPFLEPVEIEGILFAHYFTSGIMGRPIGGQHPSWTMIKKMNASCVAGHSHVFDFKVDRTPGKSLMGLSGGCYIDGKMDYAGPGNYMWSAGVSVLENAENGLFDLQWISMKKIRDVYNG